MNLNIIYGKLLTCDSKIFSHCFKTHMLKSFCVLFCSGLLQIWGDVIGKRLLKSIFLIPSKFEEVSVIYKGIIPKSLGETILSFLYLQLDQLLKLSWCIWPAIRRGRFKGYYKTWGNVKIICSYHSQGLHWKNRTEIVNIWQNAHFL